MAIDVAKLVVAVDTTQVAGASAEMSKLGAAARGMETTVTSAAVKVQSALAAEATAARVSAKAILDKARASKDSTKAAIDSATATYKAAKAEELRQKVLLASVNASNKKRLADIAEAKQMEQNALAAAASARATTNAFNSMASARIKTVSPVIENGRFNTPADEPIARDLMPNRFNTGNIAAQFQDIGVTAAMGMNPMLIALQQGTQLSAILNSMESPLKGIAQAFRSIINPVSLLSIALVAVGAALIQMLDWVAVGESALDGLASALEAVGPAAIIGAGALALFYSPAIIAGLYAATLAVVTMGRAALVTGAQFATAWALANPITFITGLLVLSTALVAWATGGTQAVRNGVNVIIGLFMGMLDSIAVIFSSDSLSKIFVGAIAGAFASVANAVSKLLNVLFVDPLNEISKLVNRLGANLPTDLAIPTIENPFAIATEGAREFGAEISAAFDKASKTDYVGKIEAGVKQAADWLRSIDLSNPDKDKKPKAKKADPWEELVKGAKEQISVFQAREKAVGLSAEAASFLRYQTELLNEATRKNIDLTPKQRQQIDELAAGMASAEAQANRMEEAFNFSKEVGRGFFQELKQGVLEGKSLFETLGDAVVSVLTKIADKMLDMGVDQLFSGMSGMGGGDFLSSIAGMFGFAKGGSFTNGVYDNPTMFKFAQGGSFGVMGEAGPEAVMPLQRGSDGSLGVRVNGGASAATPAIVNIYNNSGASASVQQRQTSQGVEIDVLIDQAVAKNVADQGSSTNRAITANNQRQLIRR